jgi:hypothetical protein
VENPQQPPEASEPSPTLMQPPARPVPRPTPPKAPVAPVQPPVSTVPVEVPPAPPAEVDPASLRHQPIPAPSEPMQYRAIGLLRGRYKPSDEQFTRGEFTTIDGIVIEAVLLGRVMSLVKNHLNLEEEHLWVVYPRTRDKQRDLHMQIVGVWEPENLSQPEDEEGADAEESTEDVVPYVPSSEVEDNYFSIRGEVVFYEEDQQEVIVKIQQAPRKKDARPKAFKLRLKGILAGKAVGYFWDLQVRREADELVVYESTSIKMIPPKKKQPGAPDYRRGGPPRGGGGGRKPPFRKPGPGGGSRPSVGGFPRREGPPREAAPPRDTPLPKPVKKAKGAEEQPTDTNITTES